MTFDAGKVFDSNQAMFSDMAGNPDSAGKFYQSFIEPAFERGHAEGRAIESAFYETVSDYQRDGFIIGLTPPYNS